jgi:hypothetical protein
MQFCILCIFLQKSNRKNIHYRYIILNVTTINRFIWRNNYERLNKRIKLGRIRDI